MTAMVTINVPPRRMLTLREAAIYCGEPLTTFENCCPCQAVKNSAGKKQYDIKDLDNWLDRKKQNAPDSHAAILGKLSG